MKKETMLLTVDGCEPITFEEFYSINTDEDVEPLSEDEFEMVRKLEIGQSVFFGMGVEVKRVK